MAFLNQHNNNNDDVQGQQQQRQNFAPMILQYVFPDGTMGSTGESLDVLASILHFPPSSIRMMGSGGQDVDRPENGPAVLFSNMINQSSNPQADYDDLISDEEDEDDYDMMTGQQHQQQQNSNEEAVLQRILDQTAAQRQPTDMIGLLSRAEENPYLDPDRIFYVCDVCGRKETVADMYVKCKRGRYDCEGCGDPEIRILANIMSMVVSRSFQGSLSAHDPERIHVTNDMEEIKRLASEIEKKYIEKLVEKYGIRDGEKNDDGIGESNAGGRECAISYCDGKCMLVKCCQNHYMHLDCLFEHILKSEKECCPVCRDVYIAMFFYKLTAVRAFHEFMLSSTPFSTFRTAAYMQRIWNGNCSTRTHMGQTNTWGGTVVPIPGFE